MIMAIRWSSVSYFRLVTAQTLCRWMLREQRFLSAASLCTLAGLLPPSPPCFPLCSLCPTRPSLPPLQSKLSVSHTTDFCTAFSHHASHFLDAVCRRTIVSWCYTEMGRCFHDPTSKRLQMKPGKEKNTLVSCAQL